MTRGERIIRYSNIIRILEAEYLYSYSYSGDFLKPNIIRIRIRVIFSNRICIRCQFFPNTKHILLSIDTFDDTKNVEDAKIPAKKVKVKISHR